MNSESALTLKHSEIPQTARLIYHHHVQPDPSSICLPATNLRFKSVTASKPHAGHDCSLPLYGNSFKRAVRAASLSQDSLAAFSVG